MNERIGRMKKRFLESPRVVDIERVRIVTEVFKASEDKPRVLCRALALEGLLGRMTIAVREDELIVGNQTQEVRGVPLFPEYAVDWIETQMDDFPTRRGDRFQITDGQKQALRKILPYWRGKNLRDRVKAATPDSLRDVLAHGVFVNENYTMSGPGHISPHYPYLLRTGLGPIADDCDRRIAALDPQIPEFEEKSAFYEACAVTARAIIGFAGRYADAAEALANSAEAERRGELLRIAEICRKVPRAPAENFWEALQFIYFIQVAIQLEANGLAICLGRLDRTLGSLYQADIAEGRLTRDSAKELVECFYLKLSEVDKIYSNQATRFLQGPAHGQCITLGGVDAEGHDTTNELSVLLLEADRDIRLVQPDIALRIHDKTPQELLDMAVGNVREGINKIKVFGDKVITDSLRGIGVSSSDAWDFALLGCSEPVIQGKMNTWGNSGHLNLAKCLELALNDGVCMLSNTRMGPPTGKAEDFACFEDLVNAFQDQVKYFISYLVEYDNLIDRLHAEETPLPLYSIVTPSCIERGLEFNRGGADYNTTSPLGVGPITAGDSLAAVKKLVFDERRISMRDLLKALKSDFAGQESLRLMLINRAPKFGNDEDFTDNLANTVLRTFCDELRINMNARGGPFVGGLYYLSANIPYGAVTAATPDGRRKGEPLNDGGISPSHGMDRKGATAVAKSVGKLDNRKVPHGCVLNQRFHPSVFEGEGKSELFSDYIRTFVELGGWECQYNVITTEALREAQKEPGKYKDLVVRVAGYSAYFTELEKELQDDIINRTELLNV